MVSTRSVRTPSTPITSTFGTGFGGGGSTWLTGPQPSATTMARASETRTAGARPWHARRIRR
ncbi:hypothetical protein Hesp01_31710 [Herbidospora sp. NBRC 101105]|nr:hypothetical protein Hesp01_31710 [Herbidospora sp. NBRC 101105]